MTARQDAPTAYHEAGHAVAAIHLYLPFKYVTIVPEPGSLGHVLHHKMPKWFNPEIDKDSARVWYHARSHVICSLAGQVAQSKFVGRRVVRGAGGDHELVIEIASHLVGYGKTLTAFVEYCRCECEDLIVARWREVEAIAAALIERKRLDRSECTQEIDKALGLAPLTLRC